VQRFFDGVEKYTPQLVSWNGSSFDLPVLHYRALIHGIAGGSYWDLGDNNRDFKFNNYISRFHTRHLDLMDVLAGYQNRAWAPLDEIAQLCGLPGKLGMDGSQVYAAWKRGEIEAIRNYCETDVANTYLLFQRFQLIRGVIDAGQYDREVALFRDWLSAQAGPHWKEFAAAWKAPEGKQKSLL
jgi:predicted PolB exonuclease-like 3'-5' exonuclease